MPLRSGKNSKQQKKHLAAAQKHLCSRKNAFWRQREKTVRGGKKPVRGKKKTGRGRKKTSSRESPALQPKKLPQRKKYISATGKSSSPSFSSKQSSHQTKRNNKKLPSTGFKQQPMCNPLATRPNHLQNGFLRRIQFWVRKTFSVAALDAPTWVTHDWQLAWLHATCSYPRIDWPT